MRPRRKLTNVIERILNSDRLFFAERRICRGNPRRGENKNAVTLHSKRKISTGSVRAADRAGRIVARPLIKSAAAVIQMASTPFV